MITTLKQKIIRRVRQYIWIIIIGLAISGITAFPIETELNLLLKLTHGCDGVLHNWVNAVYNAVKYSNANYPYLSYGTDWLAFAHLLFAVLFIGPLRDPLKNIWIIEFGLIAAVAIVPLAFIAGEARCIPIFWRLIDCSFGVIALTVLLPAYRLVKKFNRLACLTK